jgi:hypothetical protein
MIAAKAAVFTVCLPKPKTVVERMWNLLLLPWPRNEFDKRKHNNKFSALKSARKKRHEIVRKKAVV